MPAETNVMSMENSRRDERWREAPLTLFALIDQRHAELYHDICGPRLPHWRREIRGKTALCGASEKRLIMSDRAAGASKTAGT